MSPEGEADARVVRRVRGLIVVAFAVLAATVATASPPAFALDNSAAESQFLSLLNGVRAGQGLPALVRDPGLDGVARDWSASMSGVFGVTHVTTGSGDCSTHALCHRPDLGAATAAVEPAWQAAGENIGTGYGVQSLHDAFVNSPGHYANIIGNYNRVGVGVVTDGDGRIWVTFDFLRGPPLAASTWGQAQPTAVSAPPPVVPLGANARFNSTTPTRVVDTRAGTGRLPVGEVLVVHLAGSAVPADAIGAVLNVTAVDAAGDGFLTAYPCGRPAPDVSNVNYVAGHAVPNLVTVALGTDGSVCVAASSPTHVVADLAGWYGGTGQRYNAVTPARLLDTRSSGRATTFEVPLAGVVGADADTVTVNATVDGATAAGFLTAYPCGIDPPDASNLNFDAGQTVPNLVTVRIGSDRSICFASTAATNLIVDLSGWFGSAGASLTPVVPARFLDTRLGTGGWMGPVGAGQTVDFAVGGVAGIPGNAAAAVLNVTVTGASAPGYLTLFPCGQPRPDASNLNFVAGRAVANAVTVKMAPNGRVCAYASSPADVLVDLAGYLVA